MKKHSKKLIRDKEKARKLGQMLSCKSTAALLRAILFAKDHKDIWRGLVATPPSSLLEMVLAEFKRKTCIALELVFMSIFTLMAEFLAEKGVRLKLRDGQLVKMDLFTVMLASTGQMKSFTVNKILSALKDIWRPNMIADSGSTAGLMTSLKQNDGRAALWRLEEFGEFWGQIHSETHAGTPRLLLMAYDGEPITKQLKAEVQEIEAPYLSILGTTVGENLSSQLTAEDWRSGLCQRFCFVLCPPDPDRPWRNRQYALLDTINLELIKTEFQKLATVPVHSEYVLTEDALEQIKDCWVLMGDTGVEHEFVRRMEFRAFKYAVVYHWLLGKTSKEIDAQDINWAFRLVMLHLSDLKVILDGTEYADYEDLLRHGEKVRLKFGAEFEPRHLSMRLHRKLRNSDEAKALYLLVIEKAWSQGATDLPSLNRIQELTGQCPDFMNNPPLEG